MLFLNNTLIAIDIGTSAVKIVELAAKGSSYRLLSMGIELLPRGAVHEGEIADPVAVLETLKKLLERMNIKTARRRVSLSVSGNAVIVKRIAVTEDPEIELSEQLFEEAKQQLHHDMEDMYFRYQLVDSSYASSSEKIAVVVAAKIAVIEQYVQLIHELGMKVGVMDCDVFCLSNMFEISYPVTDTLVVIVNLGASTSQIVLSYNGEFLFSREFYLGGDTITQKIAESLNVDFENAEALKLSASSGDIAIIEQVRPVITETVAMIANEISATVAFFQQSDEFPDQLKKVSHIYLSGGAANTLDLAQNVSSQLQAPVQIINPFSNINMGNLGEDVESMLTQAPLYGVVVGLGLRQMNDDL